MVNRVTSLVSGLDTEGLVKQMMAISQTKYDNIMKKKTETEWKKQLYNDIYAQMKSFDKQLFEAGLSNFNSPKTTTSTDESIATVTASANAANVSHTLKVISLATSASMTSSDKITTGTGKNTIAEQLGLNAGENVELTLQSGDKSATIKINTDQSISDLVSEINKQGKDLGIKATYDSNTDRFFINSTGMGEETNFTLKANTVENEDGTTTTDSNGLALMNALKLGTNGTATTINGKSAEIDLDGTTFKQNTNDFTIAGMSFSLKAAAPDKTVMIGVKTDNSKLVDNVKSLVQAYNSLLELVNGKTSEKYNRNYGPITDEQRKEMSEKEIELWEEKAKSGILRNDSTLTGLMSKMRTSMYSSYNVDGNFKTMSSIGISTLNYQDKGKLTIDEKKLTQALEEDPDAVTKLFSGEGGLVSALRGNLKTAMTQMEQKSGGDLPYDTQSSWAKEIRKYTDAMDSLAAKMVKEENRYYTQYATMEKTLSSMNSSSSYLTSMFGS